MSPDEEREKFSGDERAMQAKRQLQTSEVRFPAELLLQEQARQLADQNARITELKTEREVLRELVRTAPHPDWGKKHYARWRKRADAALDNSPSGNIASPPA